MDKFPTPSRLWMDRLTMGLLVGASAWLFLTLAAGPGELAAVWIGNGILTGWLLSRPIQLWPGHIVTAFIVDVSARMLSGDVAVHAIPIGMGDTIEALIVAGVVRRQVPDVGAPEHWISLGGIATASTLLACAVSGLIAAAMTAALHRESFAQIFISWYAAHVVGMVIFATTTLVVNWEGSGLLAASGRRWSFALSMLLIGVVSIVVFFFRYPILFMVYPPLLLAAFRHRFVGVAGGVLLLTIIGSTATALGFGPLWLVENIGTSGRIALLQIYIAGGCLMTIPVALALAERKQLMASVRESEHRYRMLADYSHDVMVRMRVDGERLYVSPSARDILGWEPDEMLGSRWDLVHPHDRELHTQAMAEVLASGRPQTAIYRLRHKDGHYVWIEAVTRPVPSMDAKGMDIIYTGRDVSRRVAAEQALEASRLELERLARADTLTGLANRRQFDERLLLALMRLQRHGMPIALMYLDVDHFKGINDNFGHAVGDEILREFAQRLCQCVRGTDLVARLGGDEFAVIIEDADLPSAAEVVAQKLLAEMSQPTLIKGGALKVTASIGISFASAATDAAILLAVADAALYRAKGAGRNTYRIKPVFDTDMTTNEADEFVQETVQHLDNKSRDSG